MPGPGTRAPFEDQLAEFARLNQVPEYRLTGSDLADYACLVEMDQLRPDIAGIDEAEFLHKFEFAWEELFPADSDLWKLAEPLRGRQVTTRQRQKRKRTDDPDEAETAFGQRLAHVMNKTGALERWCCTLLECQQLKTAIEELAKQIRPLSRRYTELVGASLVVETD